MPPGIADGGFDEEPADAGAALTFQDIDMTYASDPGITRMGIDAASADADERFVEDGTGQHLARSVETVIGIALPTPPESLEHPQSMPQTLAFQLGEAHGARGDGTQLNRH